MNQSMQYPPPSTDLGVILSWMFYGIGVLFGHVGASPLLQNASYGVSIIVGIFSLLKLMGVNLNIHKRIKDKFRRNKK